MFAIVLIHPQIPPNTGNVIRLAANTGCALHLVEPLGFALEDRALRRAGLDYHEYASVAVHADWPACKRALAANSPEDAPRRFFAFSTKAKRPLFNVAFSPGDVLVFGCETAGLSEAILASFEPESRLRIPMREDMRSINLSNAVAIAVYEAWRQQAFAGACGT